MAKQEDIRIELFGAPRVLRARSPLKLPARKSLAILACLALEGRITRAKLATRLWQELDGEAARRNLRRELHRLRESGLDGAVQSEADQLHLAPGIDVDATAFEADLAAGRTSQALARYAGPLLDGFEVADAPGFDLCVTPASAAAPRCRARERSCWAVARDRCLIWAQPPNRAVTRSSATAPRGLACAWALQAA